jgi:hypothetical protein
LANQTNYLGGVGERDKREMKTKKDDGTGLEGL